MTIEKGSKCNKTSCLETEALHRYGDFDNYRDEISNAATDFEAIGGPNRIANAYFGFNLFEKIKPALFGLVFIHYDWSIQTENQELSID